MKKMIATSLALLSLATNANANARSDRETSGTVELSAYTGLIIVKLSRPNSTCSGRYYFKPDTDYNKAILSMLLSAQMSKKRVWINGKGDCKTNYPYNKAYELMHMAIYD